MAARGATPPRARLVRLSQWLARGTIAQSFAGQSDETRHAIEPVRFEAGQAATAAALQAADGEIESARQLFQREARGLHQLSQHRVREAFANRLPQIAVRGQRPAQNALSTQLF